MRTLEDIVAAQRSAKASEDPVVEILMAELIRVAEELCVARDRLDTCMRLAEAGERVSQAAIDAFEPSAEITEQRLSRHKSFFEDVFGKLAAGRTSE